MRKIWYGMLIIVTLSACSQEENGASIEDTIPQAENIEIPDTIFESETKNRLIDEEEMKSSIKTYLDSSEELFNASILFEEILYSDQELNKSELERLNEINKLAIENDKNFADYISSNTLPEGYRKESKRISDYMTAVNQYLYGWRKRLII
ncbi:NDxxF motif lipoprotein [Bacillus sp. JCM 19041]|uniref:NDxxF motif lipoprotein n=1 Tax=Bacillus sp. JCM 19041 TaxID=1460637 RepID=UPI000A933162